MEEKHNLIELKTPPIIETAILVRLVLPGDREEEVEESIEELARLAWTAGGKVACTVVQRRPRVCPATLVGLGKAQEISRVCQEVNADVVIFDSDLTATQAAKIEDIVGCKVVDRTQLILDIFAQRAHTHEGKLQVELAQLRYLLPRLVGRGSIMRQQGGIGVRGPGEQKLEIDRRRIRERIGRLERRIEGVRRRRQTQRRSRAESAGPVAALVGYTNAGKSSLLNALSHASAFVEDKLFATLDPLTRRCRLPGGREILLTDTVGFVRRLPHSLVAAFRATLEEVNEADLLVLVADAAHPNIEAHIQVVFGVLGEITADSRPTVIAFNKIDVADSSRVHQLVSGYQKHGPCVAVSALTGEGLGRLVEAIEGVLRLSRRRVKLRVPQSEARLVARIYQVGHVHSQAYEDNSIVLDAEVTPELETQLEPFLAGLKDP